MKSDDIMYSIYFTDFLGKGFIEIRNRYDMVLESFPIDLNFMYDNQKVLSNFFHKIAGFAAEGVKFKTVIDFNYKNRN